MTSDCDGTTLGTYSVANPSSIAFDGANIWVVNQTDSTVSKLRASDGSLQGTYNVPGSTPVSIAFDGANVWIVNSTSNTVSEMRVSDGSIVGTFNTGSNPAAVAFDGANIWVTNNSASGSVSKF